MILKELTYCGIVTLYGIFILVIIDSGKGLVPSGIKPLPEPMLFYVDLLKYVKDFNG